MRKLVTDKMRIRSKFCIRKDQYSSKGLSFNVSVVGSISNPSVCNTTTPSKTSFSNSNKNIKIGKIKSINKDRNKKC